MRQMLNMTPTRHVDSPLRRSTLVRTSFAAPLPIVNDDEAERRESRALAATELDQSAISTINHNEGLKNCLKIFHENKISKDNAWTMSLIDNFSALIAKHHTSLNNFQFVGSTLEASSKIYGLRVDSVHTDVIRMTSGLMRKRDNNNRDDNDNDEHSTSTAMETDGAAAGDDQQQQQPRAKKKRIRKVASTVVKNKETVNGKFETYSFTDPLFAKLNLCAGSLNRSDRLLQNVLSTVDSELRLCMDAKFWDNNDAKTIEYKDVYDYSDESILKLEKLNVSSDDVLRPQYTGYKILDTPAEEDSKDDSMADKSFDISQLDVAFDINAEFEPANEVDHFIDAPIDQSDFDEMTIADQNAINACKTLRRAPVVVHDMRPVDSSSSQLEYSYRPLNEFNQFWAGPSHWKFRKYSGIHAARRSQIDQQQGHASRRTQRSLRLLKNKLEPVQFINDERLNESPTSKLSTTISSSLPAQLILLKNKGSEKIRKMNIYRKWDAKKLKLPTNLQYDRFRYNYYSYALGVAIEDIEPLETPAIQETGYNYDNVDDREYCSNNAPDNDDDHDTNDDRSTCATENADMPITTQDPQPNDTVVEIPTEFAGAPEKVTKIIIPFAKTAKIIDMKQLKKCTMSLIAKQFSATAARSQTVPNLPNNDENSNEKYEPGYASFTKIYDLLPQILSKNMSDALSPSVAYYAILHLCNDNLLRLSVDDKDGFIIRKIIDD